MVVHNVGQIVPLVGEVLPVLGPHRQVVRHQHGYGREETDVVSLLDNQVGGRAYAPVQDDIRVTVLDLEQLRGEVHHGTIEDDGLQVSLDFHAFELFFGLLDKAHAVVGILGEQGDTLEAALLDPAVPELHTVRVDNVRPEGIIQVLLSNATSRRLGGEDRDVELLGERLHSPHD